jgi:hypothetical protein
MKEERGSIEEDMQDAGEREAQNPAEDRWDSRVRGIRGFDYEDIVLRDRWMVLNASSRRPMFMRFLRDSSIRSSNKVSI